MAPPEVLEDQVHDLFPSKETVFFVSIHSFQTDFFLEAGTQDDFVHC